MDNLASEMLKELKASSKRWFTIAIVELLVILGMITAFFIYESQFETVDNTTEISTDADDNSGDNSIKIEGDLHNGNY